MLKKGERSMPSKKKKTVSKPKQASEIVSFINLGFKDYIGARTLLSNNLGLQGAILGSTSIEKYFKAIVAYGGNTCWGHLQKTLINSVKNYDKGLYDGLNHSFLDFLIKCYALRYLDKIEPEFNLVISKRKVLAELDYTISEIQKRFKITLKGKPIILPYDAYLQANSPLLYHDNYLLQKTSKTQFIQQRDIIYEIRFDKDLGIIEAFYETTEGKDDGDFLREALKKK